MAPHSHPWQGYVVLLDWSDPLVDLRIVRLAYQRSDLSRSTSASQDGVLLPVSMFPCSLCRKRAPGKLASVYWAWFVADGTRSAWRQRLCAECFGLTVLPLINDTTENPESCPICHTVCGREADPVYATVYIPKREAEEIGFELCGTDAVAVRARAQDGAQKLADREVGVRGPSPTSSTSAWDALGLAPAS